MASLVIKSNFSKVAGDIVRKLQLIRDKDYAIRPVVFDAIDLITKRIHEDGKASDGAQIGTYSKGYMRTREKKYKRKPDTKVIISLTRQLENDYSVIATEKGYAIGFINKFNKQKSEWVEATYGKKIFNLTTSEREYVQEAIQSRINHALNQ